MFWASIRANFPAPALPCTLFFHFVSLTYPLKETQGTCRAVPPTAHVLSLDGCKLWEWVGGERQWSGVVVSNLKKNSFLLLIFPPLFSSCVLLGAQSQRHPTWSCLYTVLVLSVLLSFIFVFALLQAFFLCPVGLTSGLCYMLCTCMSFT